MIDLAAPWWEVAVRALIVYIALFASLRILGKRQLGQLAIHDLVFILLVSNAVQPAVTGTDSSLVGGLIIILSLSLLNLVVARLELLKPLHRILLSQPTVVIQNGHYLESAMAREQVEEELVEAAIREHGVEDVSEVELGVLEVDGTISIVPKEGKTYRTRRRVRTVKRP
jgi:uncharacterized membrane protein YcaP (DUF421 family)